MKILRKFPLLLMLATATAADAAILDISENQINHYIETQLAEKVPLKDRVGVSGLFELDYHLYNLTTKIGQTEEQRVEIAGDVDGLLKLKGKQYQAKIQLNMDTVPYYDPEKGALFLKDVRLINWTATPEKYQRELQMFMPLVADGVASVLNNTPVYTLDESKPQEAMMKRFGKKIIVEKGLIRLETSLF
ncbi:DUF1439 domain-containing protein [Glaesserella sp.]|uniref:DUF1439 domain-containing protein n=1 Tax=Glaesserella sp. TaxID=2094731 RepID=UPI00359F3511